jgi:CRP-like cAMP-binding protein
MPETPIATTESQRRNLRMLAAGEWFGRLPIQLQELIVRRSVSRAYDKGEVIYRQDSAPKGLCAVLNGRVRLVRVLPGGEERLFHVGDPGFWFGDFAVIGAGKTLVSAIADTEAHVLVLPKTQFDLIARDQPLLYKAIALLIAERYGALLRYLLAAHGSSPLEHLRVRLEEMLLLQRRTAPTDGPVTLNISQAELAVMIGVSRQTLNSLLSDLRREGLVETSFRSIRVLDPTRLRSRGSQEG